MHVFIPCIYESQNLEGTCKVLKSKCVKGHVDLFCSLVWKFGVFRQLGGVLSLYHK